ncbi:MAG: acetate kinase, partial [Thiothrix sp.]|nr:acetate kinase [Thiothrix sp.]
GLCGASDMRTVQERVEAGEQDAVLAEKLFAYRIRQYIGAYFAVLGRVDAIVFTGGIGEHSARLRALVCADMQVFGIEPDLAKNAARREGILEFQQAGAPLRLLVIPTNEELEIARSTAAICG